jgi:hypothetical protein
LLRARLTIALEIAFNEATLGPVNGRATDSHRSGNIVVAEPAVGGEKNASRIL